MEPDANASSVSELEEKIHQSTSSLLQRPDSAPVQREEIDAEGDVLLVADTRELLVNSKILTLASPVFKAMLSSKFREGNTIRSSQQPLVVPLPEDDPDAMEVLLNSLHFTTSRHDVELKDDLLLEVVKLADKYACTSAVQGNCRLWLESLSERNQGRLYKWKLIIVAFLIGHKHLFAKLTGVVTSSLTELELDDAMSEYDLPDTLQS